MAEEVGVDEFEEQLEKEFSSNWNVKLNWDGRGTDGLLQELVGMSNRGQLEMGVNLSIGSGIITGTLISASKYFQLLTDDVFTGSGGNQLLKDQILSLCPPPTVAGQEVASQFIHLENATTYLNGETHLPTNRASLWRGKISSIDGFALGILGPVE